MSGDKKFMVLGELGKCLLPDEITSKYPNFDHVSTLVFNPADSAIPEDHKVKVERTVDVGPKLYATILFWGAANFIEGGKKNIGYQIAALKRNPLREYADHYARQGMISNKHIDNHRWEFIEVVPPVYLNRDDIDFAKKAMLETIEKHLLPELSEVVHRQVLEHYRKAKKGVCTMPHWYLEEKKIIISGSMPRGRRK